MSPTRTTDLFCLRFARQGRFAVSAAQQSQTETSDYYAPGSGKVPPPTAGDNCFDVSPLQTCRSGCVELSSRCDCIQVTQ